MTAAPRSIDASLIRSDFGAFVRYAFRMVHGASLGDQAYLDHMCHVISRLIDGEVNRLLINLPPQHLKSFVGTVCFIAYLLGTKPKLRIILTAYNDTYAEALCERIRELMLSSWYQRAFETKIKQGHSRANDFKTIEGGGVSPGRPGPSPADLPMLLFMMIPTRSATGTMNENSIWFGLTSTRY